MKRHEVDVPVDSMRKADTAAEAVHGALESSRQCAFSSRHRNIKYKGVNRCWLTPLYFSKSVGLVRRRGLEPLCLAALAPQASASANFATSALFLDARSVRCGKQSEG